MNRTIPTKLRELGVTTIREPMLTLEAGGLLSGSRSGMLRAAREICKELSLDLRHMRVKRLKLSWHNSPVTFTSVSKKMIKPDGGGTERIAMLGLVFREDMDKEAVQKIIGYLGANKVHCKYDVTTMRTVVCSM